MWERIQRFRRLERDAQLLFVSASLLLPAISMALWIRGFRFTQRILQRLSPVSPHRVAGARTELVARMVRAASSHAFLKTTCLEESLLLWFLLRKRGIASEVRIGARKVGSGFEAHAWVECEGQPVNELEGIHQHYATFDQPICSLQETP